MNALKQILAALAVCLPLAGFAQTPAAEPAKPAEAAPPAQPAAAAPAPAATEPAKPAPAKEEGVKITWYGFVLANGYFNGGTFATKDYPGAASRDPAGAGGSTLFSARQSRFGIRLATKDPNISGAELSANAEFDFKGGGYPGAITCTAVPDTGGTPVCTAAAASTGWNTNILRMRVGTVSAKWTTGAGSVTFLAGQTAGLVNVLFAESVTWVADPIFWQAGQIWRRAPQFRLSYGGSFGVVGVTVEAAALSGTDAPPAGSVPGASFDYGAANRSRAPELEGRLQLAIKPSPAISATIGAAINRSKRTYDTGANKESLSPGVIGIDADINVPYAQIKGEYYTGKGMDDAYNGMTATITGAAGARELVASSGYWAQLILKPAAAFWVYGGIGAGQGDEGDLDAVSAAARGGAGTRAKNGMVIFGAIANIGKPWRLGLEYCQTTTEYLGATAADANTERKATQIAFSTMFRY